MVWYGHMFENINVLADTFGMDAVVFATIFVVLSLWSLAIKGVALWFSARRSQKVWFIVLLILNTFGILEVIYLLMFRKAKTETVEA